MLAASEDGEAGGAPASALSEISPDMVETGEIKHVSEWGEQSELNGFQPNFDRREGVWHLPRPPEHFSLPGLLGGTPVPQTVLPKYEPSHFFQSQAGLTFFTLGDAATCVVVSLWVRYVAKALLGHDSMTSKLCTDFNYYAYAGSAPEQAADTTKRRLDIDHESPNLLSPQPYELVFEDFLSRSSSCIHDNS